MQNTPVRISQSTRPVGRPSHALQAQRILAAAEEVDSRAFDATAYAREALAHDRRADRHVAAVQQLALWALARENLTHTQLHRLLSGIVVQCEGYFQADDEEDAAVRAAQAQTRRISGVLERAERGVEP